MIPSHPSSLSSAPSSDWTICPTGLPFVDRFFGGQLIGGTHGLLSPIGVGKTTAAAMIAAQGAHRQMRRPGAGEQRHGVWVLVVLDGQVYDVLEAAFCHLTGLPRNVFRKKSQEFLRNPDSEVRHLVEREHVPGSLSGRGALDTMCVAECLMPGLSSHIAFIDMAAGDPFRSARSPASGIAAHLEQIHVHSGAVGGVVIDYAGEAVRIFRPSASPDYRITSRMLRQFASECRDLIARRFACPTWIVHQLNGAANQRRPTDRQHHVDAAGCRKFGDELDACFVMGTQDRESGYFSLACTKAPVALREGQPVALKWQEFAAIQEVADAFVDRKARSLRDPSDIHSITFDAESIEDLSQLRAVDDRLRPIEFGAIREREDKAC